MTALHTPEKRSASDNSDVTWLQLVRTNILYSVRGNPPSPDTFVMMRQLTVLFNGVSIWGQQVPQTLQTSPSMNCKLAVGIAAEVLRSLGVQGVSIANPILVFEWKMLYIYTHRGKYWLSFNLFMDIKNYFWIKNSWDVKNIMSQDRSFCLIGSFHVSLLLLSIIFYHAIVKLCYHQRHNIETVHLEHHTN